MKTTTLVGVSLVAVLIGGSSMRALSAQGKGDPARQARTTFENGVRAFQGGQFDEAVTLMSAAIKLDGKEKIEGRFGGGYDYFPYFYLGQAHHRLGRCAPALDAWEESHRQEAATRRETHAAGIVKGYDACVANGYLLGGPRNDAYSRVDKTLSSAEAALKALLVRAAEGFPAELQQRLLRAQASVNEVRLLARAAFNSRLKKDFDEAQRRADESRRVLDVIQADSLKPADSAGRGEGARGTGSGNEGRGGPPPPVTLPKELVDRVERNLKSAERQFSGVKSDAAKLGPEAAATAAADLKIVETGLAEWRAELKAAAEPPNPDRYLTIAEIPAPVRAALSRLRGMLATGPAPLSEEFQAGAQLFFTGRYEQAVTALTDDVAATVADAIKPDFYAFRAAANFALYERSGRATDPESEQRKIRAIEDVKRCKTLKADFRPRLDAFSPRFIEFFESIDK